MLHPAPSLITVVAAGAFVALAARGLLPPGRLLHLLLVEAAMQFSISAYNDYFDRHVDTVRADKPVAAGIISPNVAWATGLVLAFAALLLALPFGLWFTVLTAIGLGGGLLYDAGLKYTALSWLPFAVAFPTLPLWAWAGASPEGAFPPQLAWVVPVGAILVLGIHLADTIPDIAGDTQAGVRGLALGPSAVLLVSGHPRSGGGIEDPLDRFGQAFGSHVQKGLVLPGERGVFEVFGGAGGSDREPLGAQRGRGLQHLR